MNTTPEDHSSGRRTADDIGRPSSVLASALWWGCLVISALTLPVGFSGQPLHILPCVGLIVACCALNDQRIRSHPTGRSSELSPDRALAHPDKRFELWLAAQLGDSEDPSARRPELEAQWRTRPSDTHPGNRRRARHEAAHALVAHLMGCVVLHADIHRVGDRGGRADFEPPLPPPEPWERSWITLVAIVAGNAMDIHDGHRDQCSSSDVRKAENFAAGLVSSRRRPPDYNGDLTIGGLTSHAHAHAARLLHDHWRALEELTEELERNLELDGASIKRIITSAQKAESRATEEEKES